MSRPGPKVAILGAGMAGLSTAWRLSEPGWRDRFASITVYQRGWRLGGKGASSRGPNGRIEEHGLHIWLGSYENAFALLRECYNELDRAATDPTSPIQTWWQAIAPAENPGLAEEFGGDWLTWLGTHPRDDRLPGEPGGTGRELSVVSFIDRAVRLLAAFVTSLSADDGLELTTTNEPLAATARRAALAALFAAVDAAARPADMPIAAFDEALLAIRESVDHAGHPGSRRAWVLLSLVSAAIRGLVADNMVTRPRGFRDLDDEEFGAWILRHGGHPDVLESALVRGLYDLVFGYADADPDRPAVSAGLMVFLVGHVLFGYHGALFWKMTAGMGDVVIAPLYQALRRRGVRFEFFCRVDGLQLSADHAAVEAVTVTRQAQLTDGRTHYDPLVSVRGLPVFPDRPQVEQLVTPPAADSESLLGGSTGAEQSVVLRRGVDFDHVVLAVSLGIIPSIAGELIADRREWHDMTSRVRTVATQAFQLWLRPPEAEMGWAHPGATVSAYLRPFETWASMPQTLWAEDWPESDPPGTVAYFCGSLDAPWPTTEPLETYRDRLHGQVTANADHHMDRNLALFYPDAVNNGVFDRNLVVDRYLSVNIDPSDRYVQSVPGSDRYRLRPDGSGYENLVLAGDWTDCGMNAGCIEAAVMSGLQAANALLQRGRFHRIRGYWLP